MKTMSEMLCRHELARVEATARSHGARRFLVQRSADARGAETHHRRNCVGRRTLVADYLSFPLISSKPFGTLTPG